MPEFIHTLTIERPYGVDTGTPGIDVDDYGQPVREFEELAEVQGLIQPKSQREMILASQAGAVAGDHTVFLHRRDLTTADRLIHGTDVYEILGIRDHNFGGLAHLAVDARKTGSVALEEGS